MIWVGEIEYCVAQDDQKLFVLVHEYASERSILGLNNDALSRPLPELGLSRPEWFGVLAHNEGCVLPLLSIFFFYFPFTHCFSPQVQSIWRGLSDFHYYSFRVFSRLGIPALPSDPESGGFITLHAWAMRI